MQKHIEELAKCIGTDEVVRINRQPLDPYELYGFVIGISAKLLLLQLIDGNTLFLNGYSAVRVPDVRSYRLDPTFTPRAMRLLERRPTMLQNIDITNWQTLLQSVHENYPLLIIEDEKAKPNVFYLGRLANLTAHDVELIEVSMEGHWAETEIFDLKNITQVAFDNGYVDALARLVAHETKV